MTDDHGRALLRAKSTALVPELPRAEVDEEVDGGAASPSPGLRKSQIQIFMPLASPHCPGHLLLTWKNFRPRKRSR